MTAPTPMELLLDAQERAAALIRDRDLWTFAVEYKVIKRGYPVGDPNIDAPLPCVNLSVEPRPHAFRQWLHVLPFEEVTLRRKDGFTDLYTRVESDGIHWGVGGAVEDSRSLARAVQAAWDGRTVAADEERVVVPAGVVAAALDALGYAEVAW